MTWTLRVLLIIVSALAVRVPSALGQTADARAEARARFDRGLTLFNQGDDDGALAEFQRAYQLAAHPVVLYNIALVHAAAGHPVQAVTELDKLLRAPRGLSAAQLENARRTRQAQAARVATLRLIVEPAGARVELDGDEVGSAPLAPIQLASGSHQLNVVARGHHPSRRRVSLAGGETKALKIALEPLEGRLAELVVSCRLPGADVVVDGVVVGQTPLAGPIAVAPGRRIIEVRRPGYVTAKRTLTLADGSSGQVELTPNLDETSLTRTSGTVDLRIREPGAVVFVDGTPHTGTRLQLVEGLHRLRVERTGFFAFERELMVEAGRSRVLNVELEPEPAFKANYRDAAQGQRFWSWVAIGGGALVASGGVGFLIWNDIQHDQAQEDFDREVPRHEQGGDCSRSTLDPADDCKDLDTLLDRVDAANGRYGYGWAMLAVGAVAAGAGTFFLLTADDPDRYEPGPDSDIFGTLKLAPTPLISQSQLGLGLVGSF